MKKPNIIVYFVDQQRWDTVGCYGQELDITPNLDQMASEGIKFEHAFTCQPVCGPARACLQTGKYATETGCFTNAISLPLDSKTIAKQLNQEGYETAYVGKWHLASDFDSNHYETIAVPEERRGGYKDYWMASDVLEFTSHGYDGYVYDKDNKKVEFKGYRADCITDFALDYIENKKSDKPFFLFLSHIEPHHQNDRNTYEGPDGSKEKYKDFKVPGDLVGTGGDWRKNYPDYLGCCNSLDYNLGRVRELIKAKGIEDNTIIIYTSDHGSHFQTRNPEYKRSCHEGSIRIPMIAYGPGFMGGKVVDNLVSLIDVPRTILECAGVDIADDVRGRSLREVCQADEVNEDEYIFLQISEDHIGRAIRTKRWKYEVVAKPNKSVQANENVYGHGYAWKSDGSDVYYEKFLYDLENDYHEKNNLVQESGYKEVREQLAGILKKHMEDIGEGSVEIRPYE